MTRFAGRTPLLAAFLAATLWSAPGALPASAQDADCSADWQRLCGDADLPRERLACLRERLDEFETACANHQRSQIQGLRRAIGKAHRDCRKTRTKLCPKLREAPEVLACLDEHADALPPECAAALDAYHAFHAGLD